MITFDGDDWDTRSVSMETWTNLARIGGYILYDDCLYFINDFAKVWKIQIGWFVEEVEDLNRYKSVIGEETDVALNESKTK